MHHVCHIIWSLYCCFYDKLTFIKVKHDMIMKYLINETGPKSTVENIKHLKIQLHLFDKLRNIQQL